MQDEVIKHFGKILNIFKTSNQSFIKKATEIAIEIFIIVFAVSFSIWLHGLREHYKEQKEVKIFLVNIREDIKQDINWLKLDIEEYKKENDKLKEILKLTSLRLDNQKRQNIDVSFTMHLFTHL